jgi:AcrR family transcriptional regulator
MKAQRGRPKKYDSKTALRAAGDVFWTQGFGDTSLDELSAAMGMNRPSIYRAFGNKETIYRQAMALFRSQMQQGFEETLVHEVDLRKGLRRFYRAALDVYSAGEVPRGCMIMCTAPSAALIHSDVQADLLAIIEQLDAQILGCVELAIETGQLSESTDAKTLSKLIQAILHSLAIRIRAGESKASLRRLSEAAVLTLLGEA